MRQATQVLEQHLSKEFVAKLGQSKHFVDIVLDAKTLVSSVADNAITEAKTALLLSVEVLEPIAAGGADRGSWLDGLGTSSYFEVLQAHAAKIKTYTLEHAINNVEQALILNTTRSTTRHTYAWSLELQGRLNTYTAVCLDFCG